MRILEGETGLKEEREDRSDESESSESDSEKSDKKSSTSEDEHEYSKGFLNFIAKNAKGEGPGMKIIRKKNKEINELEEKMEESRNEVTNKDEAVDMEELNVEENEETNLSREDKQKMLKYLEQKRKKAMEGRLD